ncbi:Geraniol 8-hydroxylase [Bienertia sinuspersici]
MLCKILSKGISFKVRGYSNQMEQYTTTTLILLSIIFTIFCVSKWFSKSKQLPPGPKPWPIIGNLHELSDMPHRAVAELSKKYGPIMSLKLGSKTTIIISSPEIAKERFVNHDLDFSSKAVPHARTAQNHDKFSLFWLPTGSKWQSLRKIATIQLFTTQRLNSSQFIRQKKVDELVEYVRQCGESGMSVDIGKAGFTTSLNLLSNTFFSKDLASHASTDSQEFKELVRSTMEMSGKPNFSDFFPLVKHLDLQGIFKRSTEIVNKMMRIFEEIIDGRLKDQMNVKDDVLGTLLKNVENNELSLDDVKHLLMDLFLGGTETTSSTLEWAMTELLRNPKVMEKAQFELDKVLGKDGAMQESNISELPYIQAVIKEN